MTTIEDLVARHQRATTHHEKALIERDLWDNHSTAEIRSKQSREQWLHGLTGDVGHKIDIRQTLLNAGDDIAPIWQRIDGVEQMPLRTAWNQFKNAQEYATNDKTTLAGGVAMALAEYDTWPVWHTTTGQAYRRPRDVFTRPRKRKHAPQISPDNDRKFWLEIKHKISTFMDERLADVDHLTATKLKRDFGVRLQTLCDEFSTRINVARIRSKAENGADLTVLKLARVREACVMLAIDPPSRSGDPIDIERANRNKKRLVVNYHPDTGPDPENPDPAREERYRQIIEAFTTVELYHEQNSNGKAS
jgi:hypothetical protein